jgi:hypothetical protein
MRGIQLANLLRLVVKYSTAPAPDTSRTGSRNDSVSLPSTQRSKLYAASQREAEHGFRRIVGGSRSAGWETRSRGTTGFGIR